VIAYRTQGNLELGVWLSRLRSEAKAFGWTTDPVFRHEHGRRWDSRYFRETHLFPLLTFQQVAGDALLRVFDGSPGNSLQEKIYSMHSYRRGGRSHVSRQRPGFPEWLTRGRFWNMPAGALGIPDVRTCPFITKNGPSRTVYTSLICVCEIFPVHARGLVGDITTRTLLRPREWGFLWTGTARHT
ncbi:MAG: hypothetical protein ACREOZ_04715, partial [Gloeomargaritales cyanobacterium]